MRLRKRSPERPDMPDPAARRKRSWRARLGEFAIWATIAIATALIMISMSETLLPSNF